MAGGSRSAASDDELADSDEKFDEELRAARRSWWGGLVGIELMVLVLLLPMPAMVGSESSDTGDQQYLHGVELMHDWLLLIGARADNGYSPFEPIAVLATIGIAAAVALNAAHGRFDSARNAVRSNSVASRREVYDAQHSLSGSVAVFLVTFSALFCAHLLAIGTLLAAVSKGGQPRAEALAAVLLAALMAAFLLVECARLLAPWRSPHQIQPRGLVKKVQDRLSRAYERSVSQARRFAAFRVSVAVVSTVMVVMGGVAAGFGFAGSVLAASLLFVLVGVVVARVAASALFEFGFMRGLTVGYPVALVLALWASFTATLLASLLQVPEDRWVPGVLVVLGVLWFLLAAMVVVRILGQAGIGWGRVYGVRFAGLLELSVPRRRLRVGQEMAFASRLIVGEFLFALPVFFLPAAGVKWSEALVGGVILVAAGLAVIAVAALVWANQFCASAKGLMASAGRCSSWAWASALASFLAVYFVTSAILVGRTGLPFSPIVVVPGVLVNLALLLGALLCSQADLPIRNSGRRQWLSSVVRGVPCRIGGDALGALVHHRRRLVGRSLSSGELWDDVQVLEWWRDASCARQDDRSTDVHPALALFQRLRSTGVSATPRDGA